MTGAGVQQVTYGTDCGDHRIIYDGVVSVQGPLRPPHCTRRPLTKWLIGSDDPTSERPSLLNPNDATWDFLPVVPLRRRWDEAVACCRVRVLD